MESIVRHTMKAVAAKTYRAETIYDKLAQKMSSMVPIALFELNVVSRAIAEATMPVTRAKGEVALPPMSPPSEPPNSGLSQKKKSRGSRRHRKTGVEEQRWKVAQKVQSCYRRRSRLENRPKSIW